MTQDDLGKYFWDVDVKEIDFGKHARFVIERILNFGNEESVRWLRKRYSDNEIKEVVLKSRNLNKKARNFWNIIFQINFSKNNG
jgi:hypothetical protein